MDRFARRTGRQYHLYDYAGDPRAERVLVLMGSGAVTAHETVDYLNQHGEKVGVLKVRLYRPFAVQDFLAALPATTRAIAVLDRTKEPGAIGEPLYQDVLTAFHEAAEEGLLGRGLETTPQLVALPRVGQIERPGSLRGHGPRGIKTLW
jgi:pyruvate-ferredoxin/flavodoxin oxidoreductase